MIDRFRAGLHEGLRRANPQADPQELEALVTELDRRLQDEPPPSIAMVGETGVGKSSTLNALFNAGLEISATRPCTRDDIELTIDLSRPGDAFPRMLKVFDMPGLGESIRADVANLKVYERVLPTVDAFVWVLDGTNKAIRSVQERLSQDIAAMGDSLSKIVIAMNKVDLVGDSTGGRWNSKFNVPGPEQQEEIRDREAHTFEQLDEFLPGWSGRVVSYSATRRYRLAALFRAMVDAVPENRSWLLGDRMELADYEELVDRQVLRALREESTPGSKTRGKGVSGGS